MQGGEERQGWKEKHACAGGEERELKGRFGGPTGRIRRESKGVGHEADVQGMSAPCVRAARCRTCPRQARVARATKAWCFS